MDYPSSQVNQFSGNALLDAKLSRLNSARVTAKHLRMHLGSLLEKYDDGDKPLLSHGRSEIVELEYMTKYLHQTLNRLETLENLLALESLLSDAKAD